jgi:heterodisulfide reductase subunit A-like polyferredoxin/coenzyme F420-reducing hydrogenase delta subunit
MTTGLFVSRDGGLISDAIDVDSLAQKYEHLAVSKIYDSFSSAGDQQEILSLIKREKLQAVVFAGNSPLYHEATLKTEQFIEAVCNQGVNKNKIAFVNLKEGVALRAAGNQEWANRTARIMVDVALVKIEMLPEVESKLLHPSKSVIIFGATATGIMAASQFSDMDYQVCLVEKQSGVRNEAEVKKHVKSQYAALKDKANVTVMFDTDIDDVSGWFGRFNVKLDGKAGITERKVGGVVLALEDDTDWTATLKHKFILNLSSSGALRNTKESCHAGHTPENGVFFIPPKPESDTVSDHIARTESVVNEMNQIINKDDVRHYDMVSEVEESICGGCGTCVKTCAFHASSILEESQISSIDVDRCKGCGNCVVSCPTGARDLVSLPEEFVFKAIDIMGTYQDTNDEPKILALLCKKSGYAAFDQAGELSRAKSEAQIPDSVMPLAVGCAACIDTQYILTAFVAGFDGVALTVCDDDECCFLVGNTDMERRVGLFREVLRSRHIDDARLRIINVPADDADVFVTEISEFVDELKPLTRMETLTSDLKAGQLV